MCKNVTVFISVTQFDFLTLGISYNDRQLNLDPFQVALSKSHIFQSIPVWNTVIIRVTSICLLPWPHSSGGYSKSTRVSVIQGALCVKSDLNGFQTGFPRDTDVTPILGPWNWWSNFLRLLLEMVHPQCAVQCPWQSQRVFLSTHFIILRGHWKVQYPCLFQQRGVRDSAGFSLEFFLPGPIPPPCIYPLTMPLCQGVHWWGRVPEVKRYYSRILNSDSAKSTNVKNW